MLIFFYGNDIKKKKEERSSVLKNLKKQRPNSSFLHLDFLNISESKLNELIITEGSLFEKKNIILLTNIFYDKNFKKIFLNKIKDIADSNNAFILDEDEINDIDLIKIKKNSFKFFDFSKKHKKKFNIFLLSNDLQKKKIKSLWVNYHLALENNIVPEQIFNNLFFGLKSLSITQKFPEKESGLKTFPYKTAKDNLKYWKKNEIDEKIFNLISYYNYSRFNGIPLKEGIEKFILEI